MGVQVRDGAITLRLDGSETSSERDTTVTFNGNPSNIHAALVGYVPNQTGAGVPDQLTLVVDSVLGAGQVKIKAKMVFAQSPSIDPYTLEIKFVAMADVA